MNVAGSLDLSVRVARRKQEAREVISLELVPHDGGMLPNFEAGSHIDVEVASDLVRQYSLCNDPARNDGYRLGILLDPQSRGGSRGVHAFDIGKRIRISRPRNLFPLMETATRSVLVAGGIGVTPLMAMAYRLFTLSKSFDFHYCARHETGAAFRDELASAPFSQSMFFHYDTDEELRRFSPVRDLPKPETDYHLYTCGPEGFMAFITGAAAALGYPSERIHQEHFTTSCQQGSRFKVTLARSGATYEIPENRSIAQVLSSAGLSLELSCEQGMCGTCLVPVLEGIPDHRDIYQTDDEKAANSHVAICCSRATGAHLIIDL